MKIIAEISEKKEAPERLREFVDDPPVKRSDAEKKRILKWYNRHKKEFG